MKPTAYSWIVVLSLVLAALAGASAQDVVRDVQQQNDGAVIALDSGALKLQVCSGSIVHVVYSPTSKFPERPEYVVVKHSWAPAKFTLQQTGKEIVLTTDRVKVVVDKKRGMLAFQDAAGKLLFDEKNRKMTPVTVNGEQTYHATLDRAMWGSKEAFYGLGQHQAGVWNYRGESVDISQDNTNISVPLLVSSAGYGIFWNNASESRFNNRFVHSLYISSDVADTIDYYFLYGPELDQVIAGYRELTGAPPLFGKWAYGYWQCKNRYKSQAELLGVARKYRELHIPIDNIVQDWFWWGMIGDHIFNKEYPDPKGMVDELHQKNFHIMISVWPVFGPGSENYNEVVRRHLDIAKVLDWGTDPPVLLYDPTSKEGRDFYWQAMNKSLFSRGFDAWWLDTTEPETANDEESLMHHSQTAIGSGARYANIFPLMTTKGVYEGQRSVTDQKRVFILTRSAFAGMQRNSAAAWSGDIHPTWETLRRQIPAGLNFSLSGLPYWTTDIGGFTDSDPNDPAYRELFVRWFEYGTFCPIFRVHGTRITDQNELWSYGPEAQTILTRYDRLRYRLMPYIYSVAWKTTNEGYTPMRPLVMEFRNDVTAQNVGDQFFFGPALLVNPVTEQAATSRHLYLPKTKWYDFWTGTVIDGGHAIDTAAPLDRIPLYVPAGSILPMGPDVEYVAQKPADPLELRIYRGADGSFTLYEDEGDNYNYEKGSYATIPIQWDEKTKTLTIGDRKGDFPTMLKNRTFQIVWVGTEHGTGVDATSAPDKTLKYSGKAVSIVAQ